MDEGVTAAVGLGSNMGDRREQLARALGRMDRAWTVEALSAVYESDPVRDGPAGRRATAPFLNLCALLGSPPEARELLGGLLELEERAGRARGGGVPRGDRPLDLDLLLYGEQRIREEGLRVPHPRMTGRAFVLVPLAEVAGGWLVPGTGRTVAELAAERGREGLRLAGSGSELVERVGGASW